MAKAPKKRPHFEVHTIRKSATTASAFCPVYRSKGRRRPDLKRVLLFVRAGRKNKDKAALKREIRARNCKPLPVVFHKPGQAPKKGNVIVTSEGRPFCVMAGWAKGEMFAATFAPAGLVQL